jgi:hypothetical protein
MQAGAAVCATACDGLRLVRVRPPQELTAKGRKELERRLAVGLQRGLSLDPRLGVSERLEDASPAPDGPFNHGPVNQEQKYDRSLFQRGVGPVRRVRQVILKMKARIADRFLEQGRPMFVVTMQSVVSEPADPMTGKLADK